MYLTGYLLGVFNTSYDTGSKVMNLSVYDNTVSGTMFLTGIYWPHYILLKIVLLGIQSEVLGRRL